MQSHNYRTAEEFNWYRASVGHIGGEDTCCALALYFLLLKPSFFLTQHMKTS